MASRVEGCRLTIRYLCPQTVRERMLSAWSWYVQRRSLTMNVASAPAISSSVICCAGSLAISALTTSQLSTNQHTPIRNSGILTDQTEQIPTDALSLCSDRIVRSLFPLDELRSFGAGETLREVFNVIHSTLDVFRAFCGLFVNERVGSVRRGKEERRRLTIHLSRNGKTMCSVPRSPPDPSCGPNISSYSSYILPPSPLSFPPSCPTAWTDASNADFVVQSYEIAWYRASTSALKSCSNAVRPMISNERRLRLSRTSMRSAGLVASHVEVWDCR